jgi:ATP-binding cassette subfamily B protein
LSLLLVVVAAAAVVGVIPPLLVLAIVDDAIGGRDKDLLLLLSLGVVGTALVIGLMGVLRSYLNTVVSQRIMYDLKLAMFTRLQALSLRFFTEARTGELMSRLTSDISGIENVRGVRE